MSQFNYIVSDAGILEGKPCICGTRISVQLILEWITVGTTFQEILEKPPHLIFEEIQEAILFAAASLKMIFISNYLKLHNEIKKSLMQLDVDLISPFIMVLEQDKVGIKLRLKNNLNL